MLLFQHDHAKWEKADILELAVNQMQQMYAEQNNTGRNGVSNIETMKFVVSSTTGPNSSSFTSGYIHCVERCRQFTSHLPPNIANGIIGHLLHQQAAPMHQGEITSALMSPTESVHSSPTIMEDVPRKRNQYLELLAQAAHALNEQPERTPTASHIVLRDNLVNQQHATTTLDAIYAATLIANAAGCWRPW
jgi:hypothetical protein